MTRIRVNMTITLQAHNLLAKATKQNGHSVSGIVNALIIQKLADPIKILEEDNRQMAKKINNNRLTINNLEKIVPDKKKK